MKAAGIVAEYNPFHNGHAYQIEKVREETGAEYVVVAMSGDFLQRGLPAMLDKYKRAQMALHGGADLVLEIPARWACASAEYFAGAGVQVLAKTGVVHTVCYGCEQVEPELVSELIAALTQEPEEFSARIKELVRSGMSYPAARSEASSLMLPNWDPAVVRSFLETPNNILALEYEKAIARWNAGNGACLKGHGIRRVGEGYHSKALSDGFASATAIRALLLAKEARDVAATGKRDVSDHVPTSTSALLAEAAKEGSLLDTDDFSAALYARLLSLRVAGYEQFADCSADLAHKIQKNLDAFISFTQFAELLKSRDLTYTRVCRALLHILLGIRQSDYDGLWTEAGIPYLRVLGFRKDAAPLLSAIKKEASAPLVTKVADASRNLSPEAISLLQQDIRCADLYRGVAAMRTGRVLPNEYEQGIVLV
jgi:predicted nucleotidyltransferase